MGGPVASVEAQGDPRFDLTVLDTYKTTPFVPRYPTDRRTFYSPVDAVHDVLVHCAKAAEHDILIAMYGFDDDELVDVLLDKMTSEHVNVELVLDKSQAGGVHEKKLLERWYGGAPRTSVTIGNSEKHAIMHMKVLVVDGVLSINGSTNWSESGEGKQDNQLTVDLDPYIAIEATHRIRTIRLKMQEAVAPK